MFVPINQNKLCVLCKKLKSLNDFKTDYGNGIIGIWNTCFSCRCYEVKLAMSEKKPRAQGGYYPGHPIVHI